MSAQSIHLPVFQRFDCHACTYCCRHLVVNVTEAERRRVVDAGWRERLGGEALFIEYRFGGRALWRLARRADGACVFLGDDNRCRIHAESGEPVKPLACRLYPFVPTPGADGVRIDLRMDCPSAAANTGRTMSVHAAQLAGLAEETGITSGMTRIPAWGDGPELTATELDALVRAFDHILQQAGEPVRRRLRAGCHLLDTLLAARIEKVRGERFVELLELLTNAAMDEAGAEPEVRPAAPNARTHRLFRQWLFLHGIADDPADLDRGRWARWRASWTRYGYARRFVRATGPVPQLGSDWPITSFEPLEAVQPAQDRDLEPLIRAMRLKLDAHAFAGPAYFGYDITSGLTALWLMPAVVGWMARLEAIKAGQTAIRAEDLLAGLRRTHHTFGVSPVFSKISERLRLKGLARPGVLAGVLARYAP